MKLRFWFPFFLFVCVCLLAAFLAGFSLTKIRSAEFEQVLLKKVLKLENFLYLEHLNKQLDFLIEEGERIQNEEKILSNSPFFALVVLNSSLEEKVYISEDQIQNQDTSAVKEHTEKESSFESEKKENPIDEKKIHFEREKRKTLIELSSGAAIEHTVEGFWFKSLKAVGQKQAFFVLLKSLNGDSQWVAFFRKDKEFFTLPPISTTGKKYKDMEVFIINGQGRLFFHNKESKIFKTLTEKSPVLKLLRELSEQPASKSKYLTLHRKAGGKTIYYLQKWGKGDLFLVSKVNLFQPFFVWEDSYLMVLSVCFFIFCLFFIFFCIRFSRLISAYNFLKQAILSFDKINLFPVENIPKNPLLYFYGNRRLFLNKRKKEDQENKIESRNLNFQELIKQELEKLKSKFPRLVVKEEFDFDVKLFGFERFLRTIVHELLLNALESMGGLKEPKLDLSVKKIEENLVFSIRDYGMGLDSKDYQKCFQMYYSTKSQTGVGLNLIQSIIHSNEGNIQFSSPQGGGLEVCVCLPLKCFLKDQRSKIRDI